MTTPRPARPGAASRSAPRRSPSGTNFAVASSVADGVVLCLFDAAGDGDARSPLLDYDAGVWHGFVPGVGPGQAYGYRATGPVRPGARPALQPGQAAARPLRPGHRPATVTFGPEVLGYDLDRPDAAQRARLGRARAAQPGRRPRLRLGTDVAPPAAPTPTRVIYEVHVKGFTMAHPDVPPELRGTYAGLGARGRHRATSSTSASPRSSCCRCTSSVPEAFLVERGLTNYWGYNTIGFFAPHDGYSAAVRAGRPGGQVAEFKAMVTALHAAGLEVILDVVFNHTAEGERSSGPTLCHRGLDNPAYYRLDPDDPSRYVDTTGCGNSLNAGDPRLPAADHGLAALLGHRDARRRLPLRPGADARPPGRRASTGRRRSSTSSPRTRSCRRPSSSPSRGTSARATATTSAASRRCGASGTAGTATPCATSGAATTACSAEFATRLTGSSDLYGGSRRRPTASVNLVTVHDGFTLRDLVSYDDKHNEANGEDNRDGTDDNRSWNCGVEGPTDDPEILALRARQSRALLTTLLLSFGVPLLLGGDELGRTQQGNNNAYCQDNEITWFDWAQRRRRPARLHPPAHRAAPRPPGVPAPPLPRPAPTRRTSAWFTPAGDPDDARQLGRPQRPLPRRATSTATTLPTGPRTAARSSTTTSSSSSTAGGSRSTSWCPRRSPTAPGWSSWRAPPTSTPAPRLRAAVGPVHTVTVGPQSVTVLRNSQADDRRTWRSDMTLEGKVAIVTGGNSGIGKAVALGLAGRGRQHRDRLRGQRGGHRGARAADRGPRRPGDRRRRRREQGGRPRAARGGGRQGVRSGRHHGQQRRHRDPHVDPRHHRGRSTTGCSTST